MPLQNVLRNANKSLFGERPIIRPIRVEFLAVAGGGGGNAGTTLGQGGGGGGVITGSFCVQRDTTYDIIVGDGGAPTGSQVIGSPPFAPLTANKGEDTVLFGVRALGGGAAVGNDIGNVSRGNGGSAGGGEVITGVPLQPTASYSGFGNDGTVNSTDGLPEGQVYAGAGGGAGSDALLNQGGSGVSLDFTLSDVLYAPGGAGNQQNLLGTPGTGTNYGRGGNGGYTTEGGAFPSREPSSGSAGLVIVRYLGAPILQGGTVTQSGGYTFHTYDSVGTGSLSFIPGKNEDNFALNNCNDGQSVPI